MPVSLCVSDLMPCPFVCQTWCHVPVYVRPDACVPVYVRPDACVPVNVRPGACVPVCVRPGALSLCMSDLMPCPCVSDLMPVSL